MRCPGCEATIFRKEAEKRLGVCPECDYHWYVSARERIRQLFDEGTFEEWDADLEPADPAGVRRQGPLSREARGGAEADRAEGRGGGGHGHDPRPAAWPSA